MPLTAGTRLGPYEVLSPLGAGGMGEVYLARDPRLGREVAVKVLPSDLASDRERLARFEREARLLASLNHSNIATLHGFERAGDVQFLVMELVQGDTLAQRLKSGPLPVEEALPIFLQIAEGLEAAHESGVVHRDLKPGNVKVTPDGRVKILDFGLAKAGPSAAGPAGDASLSPTLTGLATQRGEIMGTAAYMSPEQARGRPTDRRTDIWSFGCVIFETLTGTRPFKGETVTDIIAAIVKEEPYWRALMDTAPPVLVDLARRCLQKDPRNRLRDIGDARIEIARLMAPEQVQTTGAPGGAGGQGMVTGMSGAAAGAAARPARRALAGPAAVALAGAAVGAAMMLWLAPRGDAAPSGGSIRLSFEAPPGMLADFPRISPDGRTVVYYATPAGSSAEAQRQGLLHARPLGAWESRPIEGTEGALAVTFSPDGNWLAVVRPASSRSGKLQLVKVPLGGGSPPLALSDWSPAWLESLLWLPDGDILVTTRPPISLVRIPSDGSGRTSTLKLGAGAPRAEVVLADVLPGGRRVLASTPSWEGRGFHHKTLVLDTVTGDVEVLLDEGDKPQWSATGHVLFTRRDTLLAAPLPSAGGAPGPPVALSRGLRLDEEDAGAWFHLSAGGALVYQPGGHMGGARRLVVVDHAGAATPWSEDRLPFINRAAVSADGRRLAVVVMREDWLFTIWISEIDRPRLRLLAAKPDMDCSGPVWHPSGEHVIYSCIGQEESWGIYRVSVRGGEPARIVRRETAAVFFEPTSISPDGAWLLFQRSGGDQPPTVLLLPLDEAATERPESAARILLPAEAATTGCRFSPDGRWIAYVSQASGRPEINVRAFSPDGSVGPPSPVAVVESWQSYPLWSGLEPNGASVLMYEAPPGRLWSVKIQGGPMPSVSEPEPTYDLSTITPRLYGASPLPGGRLLAIQRGPEEAGSPHVHVVLNWSEDLRHIAGSSP